MNDGGSRSWSHQTVHGAVTRSMPQSFGRFVAPSAPSAASGMVESLLEMRAAAIELLARFRDLFLTGGRESVGQRLHEADECVLFRFREAEVPDFARVHVVRRFGRRPAARALAGIVRRAA